MRSPGGRSSPFPTLDAEAVHPMSARPHQDRALLPHQPGPQPPPLQRQTGLA